MTIKGWLEDPRTRLDVVAGLVDGILNALILAAGRLLKAHSADFHLIWRVAAATGLTTLFVFLMAHYAELVHAERQLNLLSHGRLASSRLRQRAVRASAAGAALSATCGVFGAILTLLISIFAPGRHWSGLWWPSTVVGAKIDIAS